MTDANKKKYFIFSVFTNFFDMYRKYNLLIELLQYTFNKNLIFRDIFRVNILYIKYTYMYQRFYPCYLMVTVRQQKFLGHLLMAHINIQYTYSVRALITGSYTRLASLAIPQKTEVLFFSRLSGLSYSFTRPWSNTSTLEREKKTIYMYVKIMQVLDLEVKQL